MRHPSDQRHARRSRLLTAPCLSGLQTAPRVLSPSPAPPAAPSLTSTGNLCRAPCLSEPGHDQPFIGLTEGARGHGIRASPSVASFGGGGVLFTEASL